jgi:hypothetical protein
MALSKRHQDVIAQGDDLFGQRRALMDLWQEIADHFYVERSDFTVTRHLGSEFAAHLTTSYPLIARRELGNTFSAMLRPTEKAWFHMSTMLGEKIDEESRRWLQWASGVMRRAMYARPAQYIRATKEGDHDFAAFGQAVLSHELNKAGDDLLFRCWHLRDVAWCDDEQGNPSTVHRKWHPTARDLVRAFPGRVSPEVLKLDDKEPYRKVECRHVQVPAEHYWGAEDKKTKAPFVSLYIDVENQHVMEEVPLFSRFYTIPRWQTVSGSQYACSPATVAALPDARLIQEMMLTLLEAGQKAADPPMVATKEALRSDVQLFAGGITWVDAEYDERLGEVLRPLTQDRSGMPLGLEMAQDTREMIAQAFFLNKLQMPARGPEMTAYEVGQRIQEFVRNALPLFEPMETDYNGALCEATFEIMLRAGAFGSPFDMPKMLRGQDVQFRFESPLHDALEASKGQTFMESRAMLEAAAVLDPMAARMVNARVALRETLRGIGTPASWIRSEAEMADIETAEAEKARVQELLSTVSQGAQVAEQIGKAGQSMGVEMGQMMQGAA